MRAPKWIGVSVILYALMAHLGGAIGPVVRLLAGGRPIQSHELPVALVEVLAAPIFLLYLVGGAGLLLLRRWSTVVLLLGAVLELVPFVAFVPSYLSLGQGAAMLWTVPFVVIPAAIAYAALWLRRHPGAWQAFPREQPTGEGGAVAPPVPEMAGDDRRIFWGIIAAGAILPWTVGIAVKLYLDARGEPTVPWSYFLNVPSLFLFVPASAWFAVAFIVLAFAARRALARPLWGLESLAARRVLVAGAFVGGCLGTVATFIGVFREFDFLVLLTPLWMFSVPPMLVGALVGFVLARRVERRRNPTSLAAR